MVQALQEKDQLVGLAASEFWSGLVQVWLYNQVDETDPQEVIKRDGVKSFLPQVVPLLLECCRLAEADKMEVIKTKESDVWQEKRGEEESEDEEGGEEGYEIRKGYLNTTLRKSACYTLGQFSKVFQEETLKELYPALEKALQ